MEEFPENGLWFPESMFYRKDMKYSFNGISMEEYIPCNFWDYLITDLRG